MKGMRSTHARADTSTAAYTSTAKVTTPSAHNIICQ